MGYREAVEDNVHIETKGHVTTYYPRCFYCGKERKSMNYIRSNRYVCVECRKMEKTLKATRLFD